MIIDQVVGVEFSTEDKTFIKAVKLQVFAQIKLEVEVFLLFYLFPQLHKYVGRVSILASESKNYLSSVGAMFCYFRDYSRMGIEFLLFINLFSD